MTEIVYPVADAAADDNQDGAGPSVAEGGEVSRLRGSRGRLIRRALMLADLFALAAAGSGVTAIYGAASGKAALGELGFLLALPLFVAGAHLFDLYSRDAVRADHSTADEFAEILGLSSVVVLVLFSASWAVGVRASELHRIIVFWLLATAFVFAGRALARLVVRSRLEYLQNAVIVGAGTIGQLVARKILNHPEYRINLVGLVDDRPVERREDLEHLVLVGDVEQLPELVELLAVERVIVAFSNEPEERMVQLIRQLRDLDVQIDIVPRLFEVVGPALGVHTVEGLPLVGLPPIALSRAELLAKRLIDLVIASATLLVSLPLVAYIAWRIKRDSPGPVFFRQTRLGCREKPFTMLKFRTMYVGTPEAGHRDYMRQSMAEPARSTQNGLFKPERTGSVTPFGHWLRRTSLDELPQLWNVIRGEMSLVGPRPCIPYETDLFAPHHFDRFLVPAGITGLWQVSARAKSSYAEALDFDVEYARGWSLVLDLRLLFRTPVHLLRASATR